MVVERGPLARVGQFGDGRATGRWFDGSFSSIELNLISVADDDLLLDLVILQLLDSSAKAGQCDQIDRIVPFVRALDAVGAVIPDGTGRHLASHLPGRQR